MRQIISRVASLAAGAIMSFTTSISSAAISSVDLGKFVLGDKYVQVNSDYNAYYRHPTDPCLRGYHPGIDYRTVQPDGTSSSVPIYSPVEGTVRLVERGTGSGTISIEIAGSTYRMMFLHTSAQYVNVNDTVRVGQTIGLTGDVGARGQPHLHVEVRDGRNSPACYFATNTNSGVNVAPGSVVNDSTLLRRSYIFSVLENMYGLGTAQGGFAENTGYSYAYRYYNNDAWVFFYYGGVYLNSTATGRNWWYFGDAETVFSILF